MPERAARDSSISELWPFSAAPARHSPRSPVPSPDDAWERTRQWSPQQSSSGRTSKLSLLGSPPGTCCPDAPRNQQNGFTFFRALSKQLAKDRIWRGCRSAKIAAARAAAVPACASMRFLLRPSTLHLPSEPVGNDMTRMAILTGRHTQGHKLARSRTVARLARGLPPYLLGWQRVRGAAHGRHHPDISRRRQAVLS